MKIKVSAYLWAESFIQEIFTGHLVLSYRVWQLAINEVKGQRVVMKTIHSTIKITLKTSSASS